MLRMNARDRVLFRKLWNWAKTNDLRNDSMTCRAPVRSESGISRIAYLLDSVVIKVEKYENSMQDIEIELERIRSAIKNPSYGRHFPKTLMIRVGEVRALLQERVELYAGTYAEYEADEDAWVAPPIAVQRQVAEIARAFGLIDAHEFNYGYRLNDPDTPVLFDVAL